MKLNLACCRVPVTDDLKQSLSVTRQYIERAAQRGVDIVLLPEMFCCPYDNSCFPTYAQSADGEIASFVAKTAANNHIYLFAGSFPELENSKIYNTCLVSAVKAN